LFDPEDLSSYVFPRPRALKAVLDVINSDDLDEIWEEDETIGWFYQYFTPKEVREQTQGGRRAAPQNSWELAFRNQFYTPRYVVRFLADNTLGRTWYEMRQGNTELKDFCEYMVIPKDEVFLKKDEKPSDDKDVYKIPFREKKDPRELKVLDPACGSGHFLLYVFDLLVCIYNEAYADSDLGPKLREAYPDRDEFEKEIPRLILEKNLYGIDIDMRAIQIAALALWLRAQREWNEMDIRTDDRSRITKAHFVCAEPMPGNQELFDEFLETLQPALLRDLVKDVWEDMKLAGEAGSLLQIERELKDSIQRAKIAWQKLPKEKQLTLFGEPKQQQLGIDLTGIKDEVFFAEAEDKVLDALRIYAEKAVAGDHNYSCKLFAEESIRGFQFIELLHKRYDVALMNPPFGNTSPATKSIFQKRYPDWNGNLLCAFIRRMFELTKSDGSIGVIFDRTAVVKSTYKKFRQNLLIGKEAIYTMGDTGWGVLDANVETTTVAFRKSICSTRHHLSFFFDIRNVSPESKETKLLDCITEFTKGRQEKGVYITDPNEFERLPNSVIGYDIPSFVRSIFNHNKALSESGASAKQGHALKSDEFFRGFWEIDYRRVNVSEFSLMYNGGEYSHFFVPTPLVCSWKLHQSRIRIHRSTRVSNVDYHFSPGLAFGKRGEFLDVHVLPPEYIFTVEGMKIHLSEAKNRWYYLAILHSRLLQTILNFYSGQHKQAGYVNLIPIHDRPDPILYKTLSRLSKEGYYLKYRWYLSDEVHYQFEKPWVIMWKEKDMELREFSKILKELILYEQEADKKLQEISAEIDSNALQLYEVNDPKDIGIVEKSTEGRPKDVLWKETRGYSEKQKKIYHVEALLSFWVGCIFGRWDAVNGSFFDSRLIQNGEVFDLREAIRKKEKELWDNDEIISEPTKFALADEEIKSCPKVAYPFAVDSDGIIPLDEGHPEDLVRSIELAVAITFGEENAEDVIHDIEKILGQDLRSYFSRNFFESHASRYLKKTIYWLLQSAKRSYSIYLYYHKIDSDTLLKLIRNYIDPKLNMVTDQLNELDGKINSSEGRERRTLEAEKEKVEDLLQEITEFKESIEKINALGLTLEIDDGIAVNIAPFREVILWNGVQKYWDALESGKCDWSKLSMKNWPDRVKAKCQKDKSLAIAHGME